MNLGYIDYLNCYPFYYHMFEKEPLSGVRIVPGYPTDLNQGMISGELDMSPVSAASCADLGDRVFLLPHFCLSSVGYVSSVVLRSNVPIEELDGRKIGITSASHTSVVLLKILLKRYYGIEPVYIDKAPDTSMDGLDAVLIIGNEALVLNRQPVPYMYDLGELWLRKTGFPVVFAVFSVQESALRQHFPLVRAVMESYRNSLDCLETEREALIAGAGNRYPDIIYDIDSYYRMLTFDFSDMLKQALRFYLDTAAELDLLPGEVQLKYLYMAD